MWPDASFESAEKIKYNFEKNVFLLFVKITVGGFVNQFWPYVDSYLKAEHAHSDVCRLVFRTNDIESWVLTSV